MEPERYISEKEWDDLSEKERQEICSFIAEENRDRQPFVKKEPPHSFYFNYGKRFFDVIIGSVAFAVFLPVNTIIGVATFFDVGRPIIFKQKRIGKDGKTFVLIKFRNMTNETNKKGVLLQPEKRITKWGRFVRKTSLDELLNFWSVIKGDMSIIGPRPLPVKYSGRFSSYHQQRHLVRPGLDCPISKKEFYGKGWQGKLDHDVYYVDNLSFINDVKLLLLLGIKVFSKKHRETSALGKTGEFIGYDCNGSVMNEWNIPYKYLQLLKDKHENFI